MNDKELLSSVQQAVGNIKRELSKQIVGQHEVINDLLACLIAGGH